MDRVRRTVGCDRLDTSQYNGRGVYVVVLDSGVASHPDLDGRIVEFRDFIHGGKRQNRIRIMMIMDTAHMCEVP